MSVSRTRSWPYDDGRQRHPSTGCRSPYQSTASRPSVRIAAIPPTLPSVRRNKATIWLTPDRRFVRFRAPMGKPKRDVVEDSVVARPVCVSPVWRTPTGPVPSGMLVLVSAGTGDPSTRPRRCCGTGKDYVYLRARQPGPRHEGGCDVGVGGV